MTTKLIHTMPEFLQGLRDRRMAINITFETLDLIAGTQNGYAAKCLGPRPIKNLGEMSFGAYLGALGVAVVLVEDPAAVARVRHLWVPRKRPQRLEHAGALYFDQSEPMLASTDGEANVAETAFEPQASS